MAEDQIKSLVRDKAKRFHLYLESGVYNKSELSGDVLFKVILYSISQFVTDESELSGVISDSETNLLSKKNWERFHKGYSGDSTLFEIGCFLYFTIDKWLRESKPNINVYGFFNPLLNNFIKQFNKIFGHVNSRDFYKQRYSKYHEVEKDRDDIEKYCFYVQQLIYLTRDNAPPTKHDFDAIHVVPFTESLWIRMNFFAWYTSIVPNTIEMLNLYLKQIEANSP